MRLLSFYLNLLQHPTNTKTVWVINQNYSPSANQKRIIKRCFFLPLMANRERAKVISRVGLKQTKSVQICRLAKCKWKAHCLSIISKYLCSFDPPLICKWLNNWHGSFPLWHNDAQNNQLLEIRKLCNWVQLIMWQHAKCEFLVNAAPIVDWCERQRVLLKKKREALLKSKSSLRVWQDNCCSFEVVLQDFQEEAKNAMSTNGEVEEDSMVNGENIVWPIYAVASWRFIVLFGKMRRKSRQTPKWLIDFGSHTSTGFN